MPRRLDTIDLLHWEYPTDLTSYPGEKKLLSSPNVIRDIVGGQSVNPQRNLTSPPRQAQQAQKPRSTSVAGISGLLADLAQAFSASDPQSWQHQLGAMVAAKATADVYSKYAKNLKAKSPMEGLTPLERARITPEQRAAGMEAIVAGTKMRQAERGLDIEEKRAEAVKGYYESMEDYYEFLKTKTPEERAQYKIVETEDGIISYNPVTKESHIIGQAPKRAEKPVGEMPAGQKANLIRGLVRDAATEAGRELEMQGIGQVVMNADGSVSFRFRDPNVDPRVWETAKQRALFRSVRQQLDAGTIDEKTANAILGIEEPAVTPDRAVEYVPGKAYQPGEYFLLEGVLHQVAADGKNYFKVEGQGGK